MSRYLELGAEEGRSSWWAEFLTFSPVWLALVIMLPRLLQPHFGLLDDGVTLSASQGVGGWTLPFHMSGDTGRFCPVYWAYYRAIYKIVGARPLLFFGAQCVLLAATVAGLIHFGRLVGASRFQAGTAGLFFVVSGPVIENFYTISKAEPIQVLLLLCSLILAEYCARQGALKRQIGFVLVIAGMLLMANGAKETSLVMIPISMALLAVTLVRKRWRREGPPVRDSILFVFATLVAGMAFLLLRKHFSTSSIASGSYTKAYSLVNVHDSAWRLLAWLIRDFPQLLPLGVVAGLSYKQRNLSQSRLLWLSVIWMLFWMGIFAPWHSCLEYYLLPFAMGSALFFGLTVAEGIDMLSQPGKGIPRVVAAICMVVAVWLTQFTVINNITNARVQLNVDRVNSKLVRFLAGLPVDSRVLINLLEPNEYTYEVGVHLRDLNRRPDLHVDYFRFQTATPTEPTTTYYVASPLMTNQLLPSVRVAVDESTANVMTECLAGFLGETDPLVYHSQAAFPLLDIGFQRILCGLGVDGLDCGVPRAFVEGRTFLYGWQVHRVVREILHQARPGRYYAGGRWELSGPAAVVQRIQFGKDADLPVVGDWNGDGSTGIGVFRPSDLTWRLDSNMNGTTGLVFRFEGMKAGDIPIVGDWDGNGTATPGYFRPADASWHLRNSNSTGAEDWPILHFGMPTDLPVVGDWNGEGRDTIGIYRPENGEVDLKNDLSPAPAQIVFSAPRNAKPVVGKWSGGRVCTFAFVVGTNWKLRPVNCQAPVLNPPADFEFGSTEGRPVAGNWRPGP
ncbi:MAG TPA: hypothetical protein VMP11_09520 [Verrucomicrobiae bacterium]|nr:hypothetical protein [Verrucomicrobiae bacterium]